MCEGTFTRPFLFQIITVAKNSHAIMEQESVPVLYFLERSLAICLVGQR